MRLLSVIALAAIGFFAFRQREEIEVFVKTQSLPRGIRNNNPLNIRENARTDFDWQGEADAETDSAFEEFTQPQYGYRAAKKIIDSYRRRGINTLAEIIATWAPAVENDVEAYIRSVEKNSGLGRDTVIADVDLPDLFAAMTLHENGMQPYSRSVIEEGILLA